MSSHTSSDSTTVAFCQNCGRPLTAEERRVVAQAVFCEPCLADRLRATAPPPPNGAYEPAGAYTGSTPAAGYGSSPTPLVPGTPHPGVAALLGFIPGVGAMYNGQYAKGLVHLVVFAVLVSLSDQHDIFGLFVAGWVFYQVIEAHHTARARRDGTPLPNPFGLNDLGERLGFGRSWPSTARPPAAASPNAAWAPPPVAPAAGGETPGATNEAQHQDGERATYPHPGQTTSTAHAYTPPAPPPYAPVPPVYVPRPSRFPTGAVWLIGLGVVFLIGNAGLFSGFPVYRLVPFFVIGVGVWVFVQSMIRSGPALPEEGPPDLQRRTFSALRGSVWIILAGVVLFLNSSHILSFSRSWPLWIILAGVMAFLQRIMAPPLAPVPDGGGYTPPSPEGPFPPASTAGAAPGTEIATVPHDREGRQI